MPSRERQYVENEGAGGKITRILRSGSTTYHSSVDRNFAEHSITDVVDEGPYQNLYIDKGRIGKDWYLNGNKTYLGIQYIYDNYVPELVRANSSTFNPLPSDSAEPSNGAVAAELLAKTNPSRPHVSLPLFIYELRELPSLFRKEGSTLIQSLASGNLKYQFGLKPLLNDLMGFMSFGQSVDERFRELKALKESGLRRKRTIYSSSKTVYTDEMSIKSTFVGLGATRQSLITSRVWAACRWVPTSDFPKTDREIWAAARNAALGLNQHKYNLWNAIPWSWLIDWSANVSDFLLATTNSVGAVPEDVVVMRHRTRFNRYTPIPGRWPEGVGTMTTFRETKSRERSSPSLSASFPALSARQLSILGSLWILRRPGRSYLKSN